MGLQQIQGSDLEHSSKQLQHKNAHNICKRRELLKFSEKQIPIRETPPKSYLHILHFKTFFTRNHRTPGYLSYANMAAANEHKLNFINQRNYPIMRKGMSKLAMQPSFRAVGQTHAEWQTFEKLEYKREMYGSQVSHARNSIYANQQPPYLHKVYVTHSGDPLKAVSRSVLHSVFGVCQSQRNSHRKDKVLI